MYLGTVTGEGIAKSGNNLANSEKKSKSFFPQLSPRCQAAFFLIFCQGTNGCSALGFNIASCILGSIGIGLEDKTIALYLSALDIDIENARQNEELSELNFTLKISVDDDLCDLVDNEVYYQIQYELNHTNFDFLGKIFTFSVNAGRINRGNAATMTIKRLTNGNIALDSISVSE